jgi:UDP-2-acetamido-2-deoxy-ribo-hexuluronate aminotransferase
MPVSLYGQPADFDEINAIGLKHGITVLEDAAQSFGAPYKGKKSCHLSTVSATSFFPAKPLGCYGDGGAVFTDDENLCKKMSQIRVHGQESRYHHVMMGINGRLDTIQCGVLIEKLKRYDWELARRNEIAARYSDSLMSLGEKCVVPKVKSDRGSVWAQYTLRVKNRNEFAARMKEKGVPTSVHYPSPLHHQPVYNYLRDRFHMPEAEKAANEVICLPMFPDMTGEQVSAVIEAVKGSV